MVPKEKIEAIVSKYDTIEKELSSGSIDPKTYVKKSKEYSELGTIIKIAKDYLRFEIEEKEDETVIRIYLKDYEPMSNPVPGIYIASQEFPKELVR